MQVKVFEATDMASGLRMVKETFGPDALILSTKTVRKGKLGMRGKPVLEITAAIDNSWEARQTASPRSHQPLPKNSYTAPVEDLTYQHIWDEPVQTRREPYAPPPDNDSRQLKNEISELKSTIQGLTQRVSQIQSDSLANRPYIEPEFTETGSQVYHDSQDKMLLSMGISHKTVAEVKQAMAEIVGSGGDSSDPLSLARAAMTKMVTTSKVVQRKISSQKRISLIGPTGVGKTTTIAKIAANYLNDFRGKIALITIDTYRIAAVEQLKIYGEIMRLPVEIVIKPEDFDNALEKFSDYELILIDTAGRSPNNLYDIKEMSDFFRPYHRIQNHLMLSAVTREQELMEIIDSFSVLPINSLIFSKIDECNQLGVILNTHCKNKTPISFLTNGQRVPEDIIAPNPTTIADLIVNPQRNHDNG